MKPLEDWTLEEIKEYCQRSLCSECIFSRPINTKYMADYECQIASAPIEWNTEKFLDRYIQKADTAFKTMLAIEEEKTKETLL